MDIKTTNKEFNNSIILNRGYCDEIYNFLYYGLNIQSDNFYNSGVYGWNYSIRSLNRTLPELRYNVYIISAYRNSPRRANYINYKRIEKYFSRIIANYKKVEKSKSWRELEKVKTQYKKRITKKLNEWIGEDIAKAEF